MKIEIHQDDAAFERLVPEWNALLEVSVTDSVFLTLEWQSTWWETLGAGKIFIITFRDLHGTLIGIAPLMTGEPGNGADELTQLGCEVSDYLDLIVRRGHEEQVYTALLETVTRKDLPKWQVFTLCNLPEASPTNSQLQVHAQKLGLRTERRLQTVSPILELPGTWDEYLASLDKKQRHEVRRKLRRLESVPTGWYEIAREEELEVGVKDFVRLHRRSRPDKEEFMDARMESFFLKICRRFFSMGWLQLAFLEVEGARAAAILNFKYRNQVLVYNSGYDPEKYGQYSPGIVLNARSIQDAIADGIAVFDFLRGDEEYKYRFGARNTDLYEIKVWR